MKNIRFVIIMLVLTLGSINKTFGQLSYSSEVGFYTEVGETANKLRFVVKFHGSEVWLKAISYSKVRDNLAKSSTYYEDEIWTDKSTESYYIWNQGTYGECDREFTYCSSLSTSTRIVYKRHVEYSYYHPVYGIMNATPGYGCVRTVNDAYGGGKTFYFNYDMYVAFSPDKSSFIFWKEKSNNINGTIDGKKTYTAVPKSELLPKAANYDFLNE